MTDTAPTQAEAHAAATELLAATVDDVLQNTRQTRAVQQKLTAALLDYYRTK